MQLATRILAIGKTVNDREFEFSVASLPIADNYADCHGRPVRFERASHLFGLGQAIYSNGKRLVNHIAKPLHRSAK